MECATTGQNCQLYNIIIETTLKAAHAFKKGCTYITLWQTQKGIT